MRPLSEIEPAKATFIMTGFIPLPLGAVSMLNSNGGVGKTRLALLMADKLSRLEEKKSLLWLTEDYPGMVRHIYDQFIEEGMVDPKSLNDIYVLERDAVQLAYIENRIFKPNYKELEAISNEVIDVGASLLVLDPLLSFYGGNENDNSQADIFMLGLVEMAQNLNISILLIHHNRKAIDGSDSGIFRGASAFHNKCRMRYSLDVIKSPAGGIDEYEHDAGYRRIRLMKDSWGGFKYWRKFTGGTRETKIKIAPAWKE